MEEEKCTKCGQSLTEKQLPQKEKYTNALTELRTIFEKYGFEIFEVKQVLESAKRLWH